jgi:NAD(P)-dependent dehydrogenase (short-subunit alcohol dehydrogenase family)
MSLVTGAASGLGMAIARRLARAGAGVAIADRDMNGAEEVAEGIRASGRQSVAIAVDVRDSRAVSEAVARAIASLGRLDILVNNVGIYRQVSTLVDMPEEQWDEVMSVNLRSAFLFSREVVRHLIGRGDGGKIVNIASVGALVPEPLHAHYGASKGGMLSLTRSLARELAPYGINVNAVAPALIDSPRLDSEAPKRKAAFLARVPLGTLLGPDDVANAVLFLSSDASRLITGHTLVIDGGILCVGYMSEPEGVASS